MVSERARLLRIAVHLHIFYPHLWEELAGCVENLPGCDLFVSLAGAGSGLKEEISRRFARVEFLEVRNAGYDVGPFFAFLERIDLDAYDLVVKLHTKRDIDNWVNYSYVRGGAWRRKLLGFCKSKAAAEGAISLFDDSDVGMAASGFCILDEVSDADGVLSGLRSAVEEAMAKRGIPYAEYRFVAGTMFMARASALKVLQGRVHAGEFEDTDGSVHDGTFAHVCERMLGCAIVGGGYKIAAFPAVSSFFARTVRVRRVIFLLMRAVKRIMLLRFDHAFDGFSGR